MLKYSLICIVSLCLLQFAHALPLQKRETGDVAVAHKPIAIGKTDDSSSSSEEELDPRQQLLVFVLIELTNLASYSTQGFLVVFKDTIKELNALPEKNEALQANITRMSDFVKETKDLDITDGQSGLEKLFGAMTKLAEILVDYKNMPEDEELTKTLKTAFEKSGLEKFNSEYEKHISDFALTFEKALDAYLSIASEKQKYPQLVSWLDKFKAEKDSEKKLVYGEFFDIFKQTLA